MTDGHTEPAPPREQRYVHVKPWQWPLIDRYGALLVNTGGNAPEELLNDLQNPGTDTRPNRLMATNVVRFTLAVAVGSQIDLLHVLERDGRLRQPRPTTPTPDPYLQPEPGEHR